MIRIKGLYFFLLFFSISSAYFSQTHEKIRIRKDHGAFYFFQKGTSSDTITSGSHDLFYIKISDTLKGDFIFWIENAQLQSFEGDTILKIKHVPGLRYEAYYVKKENTDLKYHWDNFVNGAATIEKEKIRIQILEKKDHDLLLENTFVYKP